MIRNDPARHLALRISTIRAERGWSLADLATRSGVSKAMLSKIEREEVSPTAAILVKIATAVNITLAELLTPELADDSRLLRMAQQPTWTDPATGYFRRQVFQSKRSPLEIVTIEMPAQAFVSFAASSYQFTQHVVWVLEGALTIVEGENRSQLAAGDRLEFGPPSDITFTNESKDLCRYVVAVIRR
jgi:transcriptional regulator with XRE-family HTH domain